MSNKIDMEKDSLGKLLLKLAFPAIIAQMVNLFYNIIDRIFIGRMDNGEMAMAGIGVALPIIMIISAFSILVGGGGAPLVAIKMGERNNKEAERIMSNSFIFLLIISFILTVIFSIFKRPILLAFGGSENTIQYAVDYLGIYLIGTVFVQIALGMNYFINTQGFTKMGMITMSIGAIINIILDPVFIFVFDMGVKGAAFATIIGQIVSAIWVLKFLFGDKGILKIRKEYLKIELKVILPVIALGLAPFIMQATESLVLVSLNNQLAKFGGDLAVSVITIMTSIMQIVTLPLMGLTQGAQPIISYNYGANKIDRVRKTYKLLLLLCVSFTMIMSVLIICFPEVFVRIFNDNSELIEMTSWASKIYFAGMTIFGAQIACQQTFLALGQAKISLLLALLRKVVFLVPLTFIIPALLGGSVENVLLAEPVADILATIITSTCFYIFYKKKLRIE